MAALWLPLLRLKRKRKAWSAADGAFYLKTSDGLETYEVDGTITFKAVADGKTILGYRDCGVVFAPKNEGDKIQITVNSVDLSGTNYLLMYDGAIEKIGPGASSDGKQTSYLPSGWVKKYVTGTDGDTYTSTADDGKISFGFHSKESGLQHGLQHHRHRSSFKRDMELKRREPRKQ
ncbi:MAG: hypothetical protein L6U16_09915 [Porphyromonadaceae bacterium]|nr:MAG: hypothetical protein L6U16_09915 [Porphyromonadaceae bacterium]